MAVVEDGIPVGIAEIVAAAARGMAAEAEVERQLRELQYKTEQLEAVGMEIEVEAIGVQVEAATGEAISGGGASGEEIRA